MSARPQSVPENDFHTAIMRHGAVPIADARGHVAMIGHDGTAHGYLMDKTGVRFTVPTNVSKAHRAHTAHLHNELIDLHQRGTAPTLHPTHRANYEKRRIEATHAMIRHLKAGG